jgi:hypothetical protein
MRPYVRTLLCIVVALLPVQAYAQGTNSTSAPSVQTRATAGADSVLATPEGHELSVGFSSYNYVEPGDLKISIHGPKFIGEYTGTVLFNPQRRWFAKANVRASMGSTSYDGWCAPWMITPDSSSPNGYALDLGDYSPCSDNGNPDWYLETRGVFGRDFVGRSWAWSPEFGLGVRHLSNGIGDIKGFRIDNYLYLPVGITGRTRIASQGLLNVNVEFDLLLRGWQTTHNSALGGGTVPATDTAPQFTIEGFSDISFDQHHGWALRGSAKYQINRHVLVEPYFVYWRVGDSDVNTGTATYTVNGITVQQELGFYEPLNTTREIGVKLGFRF